MAQIDLNSDLGEQPGSKLDEQIMPYISSCNIACGGHAGDADSVKKTIDLALSNNVAIGAHPGYPDRANFGRQVMQIEPEALSDSLKEQIALVKKIAVEAGSELHHVKPHGALYNLSSVDIETAHLIGSVMQEVAPGVLLYGLAHSVSEKEAMFDDIPFAGESFADRRYELDKTLRSRKHEDAVLENIHDVLDQVENLTFHDRVFHNGTELEIVSETICLHSDTKGAVDMAIAIREYLESLGASILAI